MQEIKRGGVMSDELYEGLREIYEDFFSQKKQMEEEKEKKSSDNENQCYERENEDLNKKIKIISSLLNIIERQNFNQKYGEGKNLISVNKAIINRGLQILDIQERERQRIARDLHDTSLQNLTHIIHKIELSSMYIDEDPVKAKLELVSVNKNLRSVIKEIRNTIFDLRPMTFDDLGLKESFERLADHLRESSDFEVFYNIEEINCNNSLVLMTVFRIIEECTNNAIKHSNGSVVFFELKKIADNTCIIIVADNGKSFDAEKALSEKQRHFGLNILKERVELLCGTMEIDSRPDKGTVIKIVVPLLEK